MSIHDSTLVVGGEVPNDGARGRQAHGAAFGGAGALAPEVGLSISTNLTAPADRGRNGATDGGSYLLIGFLGASYTSIRAIRATKGERVGGGNRKPCTGFSRCSRRAMQKDISQLKASSVTQGLFLTLTYPRKFPDGKQAKRHLDTFLKRLKRAHPAAAGFWKLEPQKRGAPHFHLLVLGVTFIEHEWVATAWYEVCGSRDPRHWVAGTEVRRVKSYQHAVHYVSKYIAKPTESYAIGDGLGEVGRRWGKFGDWRAHLGEVVSLALNAREAAKLVRILDHKRLAGARAIKRPQARARAIKKARRRRALKLSQSWLGSPDLVLINIMKIIGREQP